MKRTLVRWMHKSFGLIRVHSGPAAATGSPSALHGHRLCAVTTFRRDGAAVRTPVWFGMDGDRVYFRAEAVSGKAKRLRRGGRVLVAPCNRRGRELAPPYEATARILLGDEAERAETIIQRSFGVGRRFYERWFTLSDGIYVEVAPADE